MKLHGNNKDPFVLNKAKHTQILMLKWSKYLITIDLAVMISAKMRAARSYVVR